MLKKLSIDTKDKENIVKSIVSLTKLEPIEENQVEIINRLQVIIDEKNENPNI